MNVLVLPDTNPEKIRREGQRWAFFHHWPEGSYRFDWIGAYQIPILSKWIEGRLVGSFVIQSLRALIRERSYDAVIAHGSRSIVALAFAHRLLGKKKPPLVVFDIESFGRPEAGLPLFLVRKATEGLDLVIYHARAQDAYYREHLPALEGKTRYLPLGFGASPKTLDWNETGGGNLLLALDTNAPGRREWSVLLRALGEIPERPTLRIIGKTQWRREDLADAPLPLPERIHLEPRLSVQLLRPMMERATLAVLPLAERGHAHGQLTLLDLMAAGTPTIVSDTSGVRDYVRHRDTALLYRAGDASDLAEKIHWALDHPDERRALGRRAYQSVHTEFSGETFSRRIYELVRELVDAHNETS